MKARSFLSIVAMVVCGFVCLLLLAFVIHLALLSSDQFNWVGPPKPKV